MVGEYLDRHLDPYIDRACKSFPIVVLDGPRGVGKTTSASRIAESIVSLPRDGDRLHADAEAYLASLPAPVLIDEWQLAGTDLLWALKRIVDEDTAPGRFLLAGSVEPATYGPTYPLTGRAVRLVMRPMTAAELDGRGGEVGFLERVIRGEPLTATAGERNSFSLNQLGRPGFPAARVMEDSSMFLEGYAAIVAQGAGVEGRDSSRLMATMRVLATLEAQAVPDQRVWESADINKATWKAYDDLLARTHLTSPLSAYSSNRLKRLTSYPKRYFADVAMAMALAGILPDQLAGDRTLAGRYFESYVLQQMRPQIDMVGGVATHLRSSAGAREIDLVVEIDGAIHAFEMKCRARPGHSDIGQLEWFRDQLGSRFSSGFVVHAGGDVYPLSDRIWAVPVGHL